MSNLKISIEEQKGSRNRECHNKNYPGEFCGGIDPCVKDINGNRKPGHDAADKKLGKKGLEPDKHPEKDQNLESKKKNDQSEPAENSMNKTFLAFFQKS